MFFIVFNIVLFYLSKLLDNVVSYLQTMFFVCIVFIEWLKSHGLFPFRDSIKTKKTGDERSAYTIVEDLFWLIVWGYTMDKNVSVEERAEIVSRNEVWKSVAQRPDLTACNLFSLGLGKITGL